MSHQLKLKIIPVAQRAQTDGKACRADALQLRRRVCFRIPPSTNSLACASWPPIPSNPHLLQPIFSNGCSSGMHARATVRSAPKQTMALNSPTVFQQQARSATLYEATAAELGICTTARWSAAIGRIRSDFILAIAFTR